MFTDGRDLQISQDGSGSTGYWIMNPKRLFDKVIIYKRDRRIPNGGEIYTGIPVQVIPARQASPPHNRWPNLDRRFLIGLSNVEPAGITRETWSEFAQTGTNPVRYLRQP